MPHSLDQLIPSLQSMGIWTYWILALFAMLEAIVFTGVVVPGAVAVIAGGILVQRGVIDFFDLGWFIFAGTVVGSEISFRLGGLAAKGLSGRSAFSGSKYTVRAKDLLSRYGGFAMVIGRFFGPLSAFVPFSASMAGMKHRRFFAWNVASALPYSFGLPALGYFFGSAIGTIGSAAPRILAFGVGAAIVLGLLWFAAVRLGRALPLLAAILQSVLRGLGEKPIVNGFINRHPALAAFLSARFDTAKFLGLTATVLTVLFIYLAVAYVDSVTDFLGSPGVVQGDTRLANLLYALRDDRLIAIFGWITAIGGWEIVVTMLLGATVGLIALRRFNLTVGLWLVVVGNQISVTLLKSFFARPRSALGYFTETSGSFPSGHAASSVAIWGMLFYLAWRTRLLPATTALLAAISFAFMIGLSRVYLIEHYLSDVINGYLVGGIWLTLGIAFCEWRRVRDGEVGQPHPIVRKRLSGGAIAIAIVASFVLASVAVTPKNAAPTQVANVYSSFYVVSVTATTETLLGASRGQINLLVAALDSAALTEALQAAGWTFAPSPSLGTLILAAWDDWTGNPLPRPLVVPTFWNNRPTDLAFERIDDPSLDTPRLHLRFWYTYDHLAGQEMIFAGNLIQEDPLEWVSEDSAAIPSNSSPVGLLQNLRAAGLNGIAYSSAF